jgi:hypothetical protein
MDKANKQRSTHPQTSSTNKTSTHVIRLAFGCWVCMRRVHWVELGGRLGMVRRSLNVFFACPFIWSPTFVSKDLTGRLWVFVFAGSRWAEMLQGLVGLVISLPSPLVCHCLDSYVRLASSCRLCFPAALPYRLYLPILFWESDIRG